ncbi:hypothetical protein EMGBD2_14910 [Nitrospirota bacterium]|nr:hypothetical protein EMGBD2_14910 [Nitrospirota bacterium]
MARETDESGLEIDGENHPLHARHERVPIFEVGEQRNAPRRGRDYNSSKRISTTSYSTIFTGVLTSTNSPTRLPISALPTGD